MFHVEHSFQKEPAMKDVCARDITYLRLSVTDLCGLRCRCCMPVEGIMAAKRSHELIPMCHPLRLTGIDLRFTYEEDAIHIQAAMKCREETGVEMEALTAASVAALTIYDMCKAVQKDMEIDNIRLCRMTGGKSGSYERKW